MKFNLLVATSLLGFANGLSDSGNDLSASLVKDSDSLLNKIHHRLKAHHERGHEQSHSVTAVSSVDCTGAASQLCSTTNAPYGNFSASGGTITSSADSCCPGSFLQCEIQLNQPMCRELVSYTINGASSDFIQTCPVTTPSCVCQKEFSVEKNLLLHLCPTPANCCPNCECHGDPHCTSFDNGASVWAICDDRGPTCVHEQSTCIKTSYDGAPCQWISNTKTPYCAAAPGTTTPTMVMYDKTYKSYLNPNDNTEYDFSVVLTLGVYGAITTINITDAGKSYIFGFVNGKCHADPNYPLNGQSKSIINNLPSGVTLVLYCNLGYGHSPTGTRWDVQSLQDPWYVNSQTPSETFGGFCATGKISEKSGPAIGGCSVIDSQVAQYLGCKAPLNTCKKQWCKQWASKLQFGSTPQTLAEATASCNEFLLKPLPSNNNFLVSVCSVSPSVANGVFPVDPLECLNNQACLECVNNVMDYPTAMGVILNTANTITQAPTISCPGDLLTIGLNRKVLPSLVSGIEMDYQAEGSTTWTPIFALFDEEIESCGGCSNPLLVNGTISQNVVLLNPGSYRIRQCYGLNTSPSPQDLCTGAPQYNVSVTYTYPFNGVAVSTPYGQLFDEGKLSCSRAAFPYCPPDFTCCIWTQASLWDTCMLSSYGPDWKTKYPHCTM